MTSAWTCSLAALAAASLVACASTQTKSVSTAQAVPTTPVATNMAEPKPSSTALPKGYRVVKEGGQELYCRRDVLTGSRTKATETCLTQAQLDAQRTGTEDYLRRIQSTQVETGGQTDSSGGRSNGVLNQ